LTGKLAFLKVALLVLKNFLIQSWTIWARFYFEVLAAETVLGEETG